MWAGFSKSKTGVRREAERVCVWFFWGWGKVNCWEGSPLVSCPPLHPLHSPTSHALPPSGFPTTQPPPRAEWVGSPSTTHTQFHTHVAHALSWGLLCVAPASPLLLFVSPFGTAPSYTGWPWPQRGHRDQSKDGWRGSGGGDGETFPL